MTRYLLPTEYDRLTDVLVGDLFFLRLPLEVSLGTGLRKSELLGLKGDHINFSNEPRFCSVKGHATKIAPNCLLVIKSKNKKTRLIPMNQSVRNLLLEALRERASNEYVFTRDHNGVSKYSLKWGFEEACK
jgi:integrase